MLAIVGWHMDHESLHFSAAGEGGVFGDDDHIGRSDGEGLVSDDILAFAFQ
jgi:hypothetical protein